MALQKMLLEGESIAAGEQKRLLPCLDVSKWDRLHLHISGGGENIAGLSVHVIFGTPAGSKLLLADTTIWFEDTVSEREFSHTTPSTYSGTGLVMSVPVVAPSLYDVVLRNLSDAEQPEVYVAVFAQEI